MSEEKTLGQVLWEVFNRDYEEERFCNLTSINKTRHEQSAQAVITEYQRRNGEPVAWVDRKFGGSCVGWHQTLLPPDGTQLFAAPQPLPNGKPVHYQYAYIDQMTGNKIWRDVNSMWNGQHSIGARPLYAEPQLPNAEIRCLLLWVLYHHQGASSPVGQPIRKMLGIGQFDSLNEEQIKAAKSHKE